MLPSPSPQRPALPRVAVLVLLLQQLFLRPEPATAAAAQGSAAATCATVHQGPLVVTACYQRNTCRGVVKIARTNGCPLVPFSRDAETTRLVTERFGPDSFDIRIAGPEVVMAPPQRFDASSCTYTSTFRLRHAGDYRLSVLWLYTDYQAYNDMDDRWFKPVNRTAAGIKVECRNPPPPRPLPRCKSAGAAVGRWVGQYWLPLECRHPLYSCEAFLRALCARRVLFVGDSHMRTMYEALMACTGRQRPIDYYKINPFMHTELRGVHLDFAFDPFLYRLAHTLARWTQRGAQFDKMRERVRPWCHAKYTDPIPGPAYDVVVIGAGQWFAAFAHWPLARYRALLRGLQGLLRGVPRAVWLTMPAPPPHDNKDVRFYKDWRNSHRIMLMNELATEVALEAGVRVVDQFGPTYGMMHRAQDGWHYRGEPQVAILAALTGQLAATCPTTPSS